jgi:hypothetical protein
MAITDVAPACAPRFDRLVMAITGIPGNLCDQASQDRARSTHRVNGVITDAAQIAVDFSGFTRSLAFRAQEQIKEWLLDLRYWLGKAERLNQ